MAPQDKQQQRSRAPGLIGSLRTLLATLVAMAHTRLELAGAEVREEFARLGAVLLYGYLGLLFGSVGVILLTLALIVVFWETHRLRVLCVVGAVFLLLAGLVARQGLTLLRRKPRLFEASLRELERDHAQLAGDSPASQPPRE